MILRNIMSKSGPTVLEDGLQVIHTYRHLTRADAFKFRILHLINIGFVSVLLIYLVI